MYEEKCMAEVDLEEMDNNPRGLCPECMAGILRLRYLTYFTWLNEELITVPNFPAIVCDICGRREYDPRAVKWLNTLLTPDAGRSIGRGKNASSKTGPLQP